MRCSQCGFDNPAGMRFCGQCGTALTPRCPQCGAEVPAGFRFCGQCGASVQIAGPTQAGAAAPSRAAAANRAEVGTYTPKHLADKILKARSALEGERRQVTVLFADVAGFTSLAEHLDPEDVHRIIDRCFELITAEVHRFEGTVNQYTGDGVMALFGAPIAHEDGPRRAVHAALGIQRALRDYSGELQAERDRGLLMRIGLNTGPVVVGRIGDDLRMDYTAVGDTTNLAARMQQIARPGSVVVSEATHKLITGFFETVDLGETPVKGHTPVHAFEVLRGRGHKARLDVAAERGLTPYIGRGRELGMLNELFREVKAGHGQVAFITGEAGIGKSRLLLEFRRQLAESSEDVTWLEGRCISFGQSIPFLPLVDQLRENFGIEEFDGEPEIIAKIEHGMRQIGQLEPYVPYIRYLLSVDPGDPGISAMDAAVRRKRILEANRALAVRGATFRPLVFVFEDLHWVDTSTEEHLSLFADSVANAPIMVVLTYRVGYDQPLGSRSFYTTITLRTLTEAEAATMAGRVLGADEFPAELRAALMDKAEGVPLFVEEVTKTLLDLGIIRRENGSYRLVKRLSEVSVPDTIHGIIMARLDRLGEDGKRTVQLASVIGRQFLRRLLERIAGRTGELEGLLAELKALEIIYEQGLLAEPAYIFKHAVIQDVAYQSLLKERRKELHRSVGRAIEELYPDRLPDHFEELAHHFVNGEEWDKAREYLVRSGDKAKEAYANQSALDFYARALDVAPRVASNASTAHIMDIHQKRSQVSILLTRYAEAIAESERMLELARSAGDQRRQGAALVDLAFAHWLTFSWDHIPQSRHFAEEALRIATETEDQAVLARSLEQLGLMDQVEGRLTDADEKFERALGIARSGAFTASVARSYLWLGAHANWRGEFRRGAELCAQAEATGRQIHDGFSQLYAIAFRVLSLIALGRYVDARTTIEDGLTRATDWDNAFIRGRLINTAGWLHQELGDFRGALERDRESAEFGRHIKNSNVEVSALINLGLDYLNLGDPRRAIALLEETLGRIEKAFGSHRWRWSIHASVYLAEALLATGAPQQAVGPANRARALALVSGSRKYVGRCDALLGEIALLAGDARGAVAPAAQAVRVAQEIGYPTSMWQAADLLARVHARLGSIDEACRMAELARETIDTVAAQAPDDALRRTFLAWPRVEAALETLERLRRA